MNLGISNVFDATGRPVRYIPALVVALFLVAAAAPLAHADTYSVYSCAGPNNQPLPANAWFKQPATITGDADFDFSDTCGAAEGGIGVASTPGEGLSFASGDFAQIIFNAPSNTTISGYNIAGNATANPNESGSTLSAIIHETHGTSSDDYGCKNVTSNCSIDSSNPAVSDPTLLNSVALRVVCVVGPCPADGIDLSAGFPAARVDLADNSDPKISAVSGSLLGSFEIGSPHTITFTATDKGGGVKTMAFAIDNDTPQVEESGGACTVPYSDLVPCPLSKTHTFGIDTALLTPGPHTFTLSTTDAAGNSTSSIASPFTVLPGGIPTQPTSPIVNSFSNGSPAIERPVLTLPAKTVIAKKRGLVPVAGKLTTPSGAPVSGATLSVSSLDIADKDAAAVALAPVTTASDGTFSVPFPAAGAKRLTVGFKPSASAAVTVSATVLIRQKLSLSAKRSRARINPGKSVTISGVLSGAGGGAKGAPVEIDARFHHSWRAVGVVKASSSGKYRWKYRFVRVTRPTKFTFRVVARGSRAWPWPTEIGSTVKVLVAR